MNVANPENRFSDRVEDYIKYRPGYPPELISFLNDEIGFGNNWVVADIGSGTGILTELFLKNGNKVFGVEPNEEMRKAGENMLKKYPYFISLEGSAESVPLPAYSVDIISAGQAFHWFDVEKSKNEFLRIIKPGGYVLLIWNKRLTDIDLFAEMYEKLLQDFSIDYQKVDHRKVDDKILSSFFYSYKLKTFSNSQELDFEGLKGRLLSSSYAPKEDHPNHLPMMEELKKMFDVTSKEGKVQMVYETQLYYGKL